MNEQNAKAFEYVWSEVILPTIKNSFNNMDKDFKNATDSRIKDLDQLHNSFEKRF